MSRNIEFSYELPLILLIDAMIDIKYIETEYSSMLANTVLTVYPLFILILDCEM